MAGPRVDVPINATMWHTGADIAPIICGTKYNVLSSGKNGVAVEKHDLVTNASGKYIKVRYPDGVVLSYCHLSSIRSDLHVGSPLSQGEKLGVSGNTSATIKNMAVHLHITARKDGLLINPTKLINEDKIVYLNPPNSLPIKTR